MTTSINTKNETLANYAQLLHENGYYIITRDESSLWFLFSDGKTVCSCSQGFSKYTGLSLSINHKPSRDHGTGFGFKQDIFPTLQDAKDCLLFNGWGNRSTIKYYTDMNDYITSTHNAWAGYKVIEPMVTA